MGFQTKEGGDNTGVVYTKYKNLDLLSPLRRPPISRPLSLVSALQNTRKTLQNAVISTKNVWPKPPLSRKLFVVLARLNAYSILVYKNN